VPDSDDALRHHTADDLLETLPEVWFNSPRFPCRHPWKLSLISTFATLFIHREKNRPRDFRSTARSAVNKYRVSRDVERIISLEIIEKKRIIKARVANDIL